VSVFATDDDVVVRATPRLRVLTAPPPSLDDLVAEHGPWLRKFVRRRMADPALVDDAVQETLLRVCRATPPADREQVRPWLTTIAKRTCADVWRAHTSRVEILDSTGEQGAAGGGLVPGSDEHLVAVSERARIDRALQQLPPRHRRLLVKQALLGLSYEQIADEEDISVACVTSALGRARAGFRRRYADASAAWVAVVYRVVGRLRSKAQTALAGHVAELAAASVTLGMAAVLVVLPAHSHPEQHFPVSTVGPGAAAVDRADGREAPSPPAPKPAPLGSPRTAPAARAPVPPERPASADPSVGDVSARPPRVELTPQAWTVDFGVEAEGPGGVATVDVAARLHCEGGQVVGAVCPVAEQVPGSQSSR
jgi:RNA polymerase sigma factor (sigma-70 family)